MIVFLEHFNNSLAIPTSLFPNQAVDQFWFDVIVLLPN